MAGRPEDRTVTHVARGPGRPHLLAYWDGGAIQRDLPATGSLTLGRSETCDVFLDHASVSRAHARIVVTADEVTIEDLGSSNGTQLNAQRLEARRPFAVRPGDAVRVGAVTVVVTSTDPSARSAAVEISNASVTTATSEPNSAPVAVDPRSREVFDLARTAAAGTISVLVLGETGVGKEVVAEELHRSSARAGGVFTRLNCAAIPESLFESTLFGHERGAFTGATAANPGALEATDGGTLFLDEIGEMPLQCQAKILRVIETGEVLRVGSYQPRRVDVRFVAATNRNLAELAREGRFRQDLFYRISGITVVVPPLRDRPDDIPELALRFLDEFGGPRRPPLEDGVLERLVRHAWPGNVRELRHVIERAVLLARGGAVGVRHLPALGEPMPTIPPGAPASLRGDLEAIERQRILDALTQCGGNQTQAAKLLGMPRRTLVSRIETYQLPRPRKKDGT